MIFIETSEASPPNFSTDLISLDWGFKKETSSSEDLGQKKY